MSQSELIERLKAYDPTIDEDLLNKAFAFSIKVHGAQLRESGDPYFSHPIEVASILIDMKLDCYSVITGLLHDTVEDTVVTLEEIETLFGSEIARLVNGVTKLSKLELQSEETRQAENFRKLVIAMSSDIRVLLVKLADRLHNMRTLHHVIAPEKRRRIARETMEIYVPLAERMGIQGIKNELEDLGFSVLNPEMHESIKGRLRFLHESSESTIDTIITDLNRVTQEAGLQCLVSGRVKTPYSIWEKMQKKNVTFEQLSDIMAFRILVDTVADCYQALGIMHSQYHLVPGRFKDYISTPKANDYRSLHTALIGPLNHRIEVQIRTNDMHQVSELGVAAHWEYKKSGPLRDGKQYVWLRSLLDILDQTSGPEEFLEHTKLEMFQDQVFCFTPKGELIPLPRDATPVDFAYAIHSGIGDRTVGAKINGRQMPLRTQLQNGDQVEIITVKNQCPSPTWERFVVTGKARARIRRFVRSQQREQFGELGKSLLQKTCAKEGLVYSEKNFSAALKHFHYPFIADLFACVGEGLHTAKEVITVAYPTKSDDKQKNKAQTKPAESFVNAKTAGKIPVCINGLIPGMAMHFAGCCHPLPGDKIIGVITTGKGVTIHTHDCEGLSLSIDPDRVLDLSWQENIDDENLHVGRLKVIFLNKAGSLASMTAAISKLQSNLINLKITHRTAEFWDLFVDVEVKSAEHLQNIEAALRSIPVINYVARI